MGQGLYGLSEPELPKKPPSKWRWVWHVFFVAVVIVCGGLFALSKAANTSDDMKKTIENIFSESSGLDTKIGTLNAISFFPIVGLDISDVVFSRADMPIQVAKIGQANYSTGFWSVMLSRFEFRTISVKDAKVDAGLILPRYLIVHSLALDIKNPQVPALVLDAIYGGEVLKARMDLAGDTFGNRQMRFTIPKRGILTFTMGPVEGEFEVIDPQARDTIIKIIKLTDTRTAKTYHGELSLIGGWEGLAIKGKIESEDGFIVLDTSIKHEDERTKIGGTIDVSGMKPEDLNKPGGIVDLARTMTAFITGQSKDNDIALGPVDAALTMTIDGAGNVPVVMVDGWIPSGKIKK